jgi:hypothetical protein
MSSSKRSSLFTVAPGAMLFLCCRGDAQGPLQALGRGSQVRQRGMRQEVRISLSTVIAPSPGRLALFLRPAAESLRPRGPV